MNINFIREVTVCYRGPRRKEVTITGPKDAAIFIRKVLPDNSREHFIALYLNGAHQPVAFFVVGTGSANSCPVHPREVFQGAVLTGAVALIVAHNHPSGQVVPSPHDKKVTVTLVEAGKLLGIPVLDHVILGERSHYSFADSAEM